MNFKSNKIAIIGSIVGLAILGGINLIPAQPTPLTPVTLNATKLYFATFANATSGAVVKQSLTQKQYTDLAKANAVNPTKAGYVFTGAYEGQLYSTGRDELANGEYMLDGNGKAVVSLSKEQRTLDATFIVNNTLSTAGVIEFKK